MTKPKRGEAPQRPARTLTLEELHQLISELQAAARLERYTLMLEGLHELANEEEAVSTLESVCVLHRLIVRKRRAILRKRRRTAKVN